MARGLTSTSGECGMAERIPGDAHVNYSPPASDSAQATFQLSAVAFTLLVWRTQVEWREFMIAAQLLIPRRAHVSSFPPTLSCLGLVQESARKVAQA